MGSTDHAGVAGGVDKDKGQRRFHKLQQQRSKTHELRCYCAHDGFEDGETFLCRDLLGRLKVDNRFVSCNGTHEVTSYFGVTMKTEEELTNCHAEDLSALYLVGGPENTQSLEHNEELLHLIREFDARGGLIVAQCSAPARILGHNHLLKGRHYTCSSGLESTVDDGIFVDALIVHDGNLVTGRGLGASMDFALYTGGLIVNDQEAAKWQATHFYYDADFARKVVHF